MTILDRPQYKVIHAFAYRGKRYKPGAIAYFPDDLAHRLFRKDWIVSAADGALYTDVCIADWSMPERVFIVGSGPLGVPHYDRIPTDAFIIVVNKMILSPLGTRAAIWMVTDPNHPRYEWFCTFMGGIKDSGRSLLLQDVKVGGPPIPFMDYDRIITHFPYVRCMYRTGPPLFEGAFNLPPNRLRSGATVAGQAVQLAAKKGVREIFLCGLDMFGDTYFDGTKHEEAKRANRTWGALPNFNKVVKFLSVRQGIKFASLSETRIAVDRV
jgi:hypothetical protein